MNGTTDPGTTEPRKPRRHRVRNTILITLAGIGAITVAGTALSNHSPGITAAPEAAHSAVPAGSAPTDPAPADTAPPAPAGPDTLAVGQPESLTQDGQNAGTVAVKSVSVTTQPADPEFGEPPAHGYYVVVHLTAKADSSFTEGLDVNSFDFYARAHGTHYDSDNGNAYEALTNAQSDQELSATLAAGERSDGYIAFDVPSPHGKIVYAPNYDGQPLAMWRY